MPTKKISEISTSAAAIADGDLDENERASDGVSQKVAWSLRKSVLKTYFDTLYRAIGSAVLDSDLSTSDITTNNATTAKHGFQAKGDNDITHFYRSDMTQAVPPYPVYFVGQGNITLADGATYYCGWPLAVLITTTANLRKATFSRGGTITRADLWYHNNGGTVGSGESNTLNFRLNNTTDIALDTAFLVNAAANSTTFVTKTGLSIAVATGDTGELKLVLTTLVTNPTNGWFGGTLWVS